MENLNFFDISKSEWDLGPYPCSAEQITELETHYRRSFPEDYVSFLLNVSNGGEPKCSPLIFVPPPQYSYEEIRYFAGIGFQHQNLLADLDYFIPLDMGFVPIAADYFGNKYCLSLELEPVGSVWFYDHETYDGENPLSMMTYICLNFKTFLDNLLDEATIEDHMNRAVMIGTENSAYLKNR